MICSSQAREQEFLGMFSAFFECVYPSPYAIKSQSIET